MELAPIAKGRKRMDVFATLFIAAALVNLDFIQIKVMFVSDQVALHDSLYAEFLRDEPLLSDESLNEGRRMYRKAEPFSKGQGTFDSLKRALWSINAVETFMITNEELLSFQLKHSLLEASEVEAVKRGYREFNETVVAGLRGLSSWQYLLAESVKLLIITLLASIVAGGIAKLVAAKGLAGHVLTYLSNPKLLCILAYWLTTSSFI